MIKSMTAALFFLLFVAQPVSVAADPAAATEAVVAVARADVVAIPTTTVLLVADPADDEAVAQPNLDTSQPSDSGDVIENVEGTIGAVRTGSWIAIASALITLLLTLMRLPALGSLTKKIPTRWRVPTVLILGALAGVLSNMVGGVPWHEALSVALFTGPTAVFHNEFFLNSVLGRRAKRKDTADVPNNAG